MTAPQEKEDRQALARHVRTRREALELTQADVLARGGPSISTLTAVENPTPGGPAVTRWTLSKLDKALDWTAGSAQVTLTGGEPTPVGARRVATLDGPSTGAATTAIQLADGQTFYIVGPATVSDEEKAIIRGAFERRAGRGE